MVSYLARRTSAFGPGNPERHRHGHRRRCRGRAGARSRPRPRRRTCARAIGSVPQARLVIMKDGRSRPTRTASSSDDIRRQVDGAAARARRRATRGARHRPGRHRADPDRRHSCRDWSCCRLRRRAACSREVGAAAVAARHAGADCRDRDRRRRDLRARAAAAARARRGRRAARRRRPGGARARQAAATRSRAWRGAFNRMAGELAARDEALRTSDRLRRQMLADVSHELRTPLTTMRGYLETLRDAGSRARRRHARGGIWKPSSAKRGGSSASCTDLLDLARYENGVGAARGAGVRRRPRVQPSSAAHERERGARRHDVRAHDRAGTPTRCRAIPDRLEQVDRAISSPTRVRHTPTAAPSSSSAPSRRRRSSCRWSTQATASRPSTCRTCSIGSTRWTRRAPPATGGSGLGCRSSRRSSSATAARSR